tara:strand:- start:1183 stop:1461 length:279 start_codon:yes stop_codon:yes gene_type:complete
MIIEKDLEIFEVVAVHRDTGRPQFAKVKAPSVVDAEDFVADMQPDWLVIRDNSDLEKPCNHCEKSFPVDELRPCAVEPDFHFCDDCADKLRA